jgi:hypothetical protein
MSKPTEFWCERLGGGDWAVSVWRPTDGKIEKIEDHIFVSKTVEDIQTGQLASAFAENYKRLRYPDAKITKF